MQKLKSKLLSWPALVFATLVLFVLGARGAHEYLVEQNEQLVHSVAQTLLPALLANDQEQVQVLLKSLEAYPSIERIDLVSSEGAGLASLTRVGDRLGPVTSEFALASADVGNDLLQLAAPITFDSLILANLHIAVNIWPAYMRIMSWLGMLLIIPSLIYVFVKQMRIKLRFEQVLSKSEAGDDLGEKSFNLHAVMKEAFEEARISVEYQPVRRLTDGGLYGFELMVCWHHPSGQTLHLSPADFVKVAKKWGMFLPVGDWVLETACKDAAKWQREHGPLVMSFNISSEQFQEPGFGSRVREICQMAGYPVQLIEFELNESWLVKQSNFVGLVESFLAQGLSLTIDQFGLSRQSFDMLKSVSIQKIKLDAKLLVNIEQDKFIQDLVGTIVEQALQADVQVMCDGVSRTSQLQLLSKLGCSHGQGAALSEIMSKDKFQQYLASQPPRSSQSTGANWRTITA